MYLTKTEKQIELLRTLAMAEMRALPLPVLRNLRQFLKEEKLVRINGKVMVNSFLPPFPSRAFRQLAAGIQSLLKGTAVPVSAYVAVTNRCRFNCWHCSREYRGPGELPTDVLLRTVSELQDLGVSIIGFTGGEPLLREELEDVVGAVDERSVTLLFTTGDGFTEEKARRLKDRGLFGVAVSLDHHTAEIHDRRRGRPGAFETALEAIRISRRTGFYAMIQLVGTRDVIEGEAMEKYLALARDLDVHEIRLLEPMPTGRLLTGDPGCRLTPAERREIQALHRRTNRTRGMPKVNAFAHVEDCSMYGCGAGFQHLYVDAEGHVCPCDFTPISFGNVREEPLSAIWGRLNAAFRRPRPCCFLLENADKLRGAFRGRLPIPYENVKHVCDFRPSPALPAYYGQLGWK